MNHTIYLCGPIVDRNDEQCITWRRRAADLWAPWPVKDPMSRDYRGVTITTSLAHKIVEDDLADIAACAGLLVMYDGKPSVGTSMEIYHAKAVLGLPVVLVNPTQASLSPWLLAHVDHVAFSLGEGISALRLRIPSRL